MIYFGDRISLCSMAVLMIALCTPSKSGYSCLIVNAASSILLLVAESTVIVSELAKCCRFELMLTSME